MNTDTSAGGPSAAEIAAESDTGGRALTGTLGGFVALVAFIWACFQLYIASGVPYWVTENFGINAVFNNTQSRIVHLAFAIALATFSYPLLKRSARHTIPWYDWILAIVGVSCCLYLLVFKDDIASRAGLPTRGDIIASSLGLASLAIAVFRSLGLPMLCVAGVFVLYVFFGDADWLPGVIQWKGRVLRQGAVALLDADRRRVRRGAWRVGLDHLPVRAVRLAAGEGRAGNYFIKLAFALLGHMRGGPAKAAVVASAMSGLYSGSSISNVVTTGTFTIPLMKRTGFAPEKAGAVEVASSTNGQLTPPVMGAAAFLITEFVGISYPELMMNAILPAAISYIALVYIVHLEAMKLGLEGLKKPPSHVTLAQKLIGVLTGFLGMAAWLLRSITASAGSRRPFRT
jgi:TRAP-type uncharacterized transport system fused permease subunit